MSPQIEQVVLSSDLTLSRVLTGLWQVADMERGGTPVDMHAAARAMERYVAAGLTTFDMADHYGSAELIAGHFRGGPGRHRHVQFLTKWVPKPGPVSREDVRAAVERAEQRLQVRKIDMLQFHTWSYADPSWLDALLYLQELKEQGRIGSIGVTNFDTAHLRIAVESGIEILTNQVSFSLLDRRAAGRMADYCLARGVKLLAYGAIAGGWLSERWLGKAEPDWERSGTWSQMKYGRFIRAAGGWDRFQRVLRAAAAVAGRHGVSVANVASRYVLEHPAVAGVIIGARLGESEHIADTVRLFSFTLTDTDRAEIGEALESLHSLPGDTGDEYRKPPFLTASGDLSHHLSAFPPPYHVEVGEDGKTHCLSNTPWESLAGYARGVRYGNHISVSGTTATHRDRQIGGDDAAAQAHFVFDKIEGALQSLGGRLEDVVRTRVFVRNIADWEPVARAHGERFGSIRPANTLVQTTLVGERNLVEIEAEAELSR